MHRTPRVLLPALCAVALVTALLLLARSGDPSTQPAGEPPTASVLPAHGAGEQGSPVALGIGNSTDGLRVEGGSTPSSTPPAGASGTGVGQGATVPDGRVLSLTVVDAERRPVSGLALRLTQDGRSELGARTDAEGRLVTAAMWLQGVVEVEHATDAEQPLRWRLEPGQCLVEVGPGEVQEAELSASAPAAGLRILARHADDSPLAGALVWISLAALDSDQDWQPVRRATTGADGLAVIPLYGTEASTCRAMYGLHVAKTEVVARTLYVEPPLDATFELVAYPPSEVLVRTVDEQGEPVSGLQVVAHPKERYMGIYGERTLVDALGQARLSPMAPGTYTVKARYPGQASYPFSTSLELAPAEHAEVTLTVTPGEQPVVVAAGIVLDESGEPLERVQVSLQLGNGRPQRVRTDADGRFLLAGQAGPENVRVTAEASIFGDTFEPHAVEVPFGADDLEFRRTAHGELTSSLFNLLDAYTGEPLSEDAEAMLYVYREPEPGRRIHAFMTFTPDARGVCQVDYHPHADLRYVVEALGYQRQSGALQQAAFGEPPALHRIELLPGYSRHLVVRARDEGVLAGVRVSDTQGRVLATSDARGELHLDLPAAPGTLLFEAEGFSTLVWESYNYWGNASRTVWLSPL